MKLTKEERAARKASFREMSAADKADYIFTYYKLPIILALLALWFVGSTVYRQITKKEAVLYAAHVNVSVGDDIERQLDVEFISAIGANPRKAEVYLYRGLYLSDDASTENHQYGYASRLKILAVIEAKQLDVVLMNRESYDILSQNDYLLDLSDFFSENASLGRLLEPYLETNTVIIEDNAIEYNLNEADEYVVVTEEAVNGIDVSAFPVLLEARFPDTVYLGIIANSPRLPAVTQYIEYLASTTGKTAAREMSP